mmetsp:Transcript_26561/g.55110  ORF Transcript_26561/g.55110 Transcript_26561/m.55110 type:complete len:213 (+) Transcript_26561:60-698(+)
MRSTRRSTSICTHAHGPGIAAPPWSASGLHWLSTSLCKSSPQPHSLHSRASTSSQSPAQKTSDLFLGSSKRKPFSMTFPMPPQSGARPTLSRLTSSLGHPCLTLPTRSLNGRTASEVPTTTSRSQAERSESWRLKKRSGRDSPKKTMSGFTRPLYFVLSCSRPDCPWTKACLNSSRGTGVRLPATWQLSMFPCAATTSSAGRPAVVSKESMF